MSDEVTRPSSLPPPPSNWPPLPIHTQREAPQDNTRLHAGATRVPTSNPDHLDRPAERPHTYELFAPHGPNTDNRRERIRATRRSESPTLASTQKKILSPTTQKQLEAELQDGEELEEQDPNEQIIDEDELMTDPRDDEDPDADTRRTTGDGGNAGQRRPFYDDRQPPPRGGGGDDEVLPPIPPPRVEEPPRAAFIDTFNKNPDDFGWVTPFLGGRALFEAFGPENLVAAIQNVLFDPGLAGPDDIEVIPLGADKKTPANDLYGPPFALALRANDTILELLATIATYIATQDLAFHIVRYNPGLCTWTLALYTASSMGGDDSNEGYLRWCLAAFIFDDMKLQHAFQRATGTADKRPILTRLLDWARTVYVVWNPYSKHWCAYAEPCTPDYKGWESQNLGFITKGILAKASKTGGGGGTQTNAGGSRGGQGNPRGGGYRGASRGGGSQRH
ncbi:hypothetical protein B0H16DRAFT_1463483 [Mycena metata]|uniref:Uncharacterized protein n=1 Tax=Mycena metata TaxID=1033252 RepID=A0AAD7N3E0_9AGAR|nr:hypothetical protein B0H16DRAFT_1463483 [Mycena metata]